MGQGMGSAGTRLRRLERRSGAGIRTRDLLLPKHVAGGPNPDRLPESRGRCRSLSDLPRGQNRTLSPGNRSNNRITRRPPMTSAARPAKAERRSNTRGDDLECLTEIYLRTLPPNNGRRTSRPTARAAAGPTRASGRSPATSRHGRSGVARPNSRGPMGRPGGSPTCRRTISGSRGRTPGPGGAGRIRTSPDRRIRRGAGAGPGGATVAPMSVRGNRG